nr:hypothetical protein [Tanacetum cinerariifolium]
QTRPKKYYELTKAQQLQDDCDVQATNIVLHGLPLDVYSLVNHQEATKDIWDGVKILMKGTELSHQEPFQTEDINAYDSDCDDISLAKAVLMENLSSSDSDVLFETIPHNLAFQTEDINAYDSNFDDISLAKAVLMENLSSSDSDVLFEVPYSDTYPNDMINQDVQKMSYSKQTHIDDFPDEEVILNGDSPAPTRVIKGCIQPVAPTTAEQTLARKNELKARGTLLMALPDKHQLKFNIHKDAKT